MSYAIIGLGKIGEGGLEKVRRNRLDQIADFTPAAFATLR